jgi:hypothetical protein
MSEPTLAAGSRVVYGEEGYPMNKAYLLVSASIFGVVAVLHLLRAVLGTSIDIGGASFPIELSWGGLVVAALLSIWGFRLAGNGADGS